VSYRLAATALPMLLKHFGNGPQCFVHLFGGSKVACHIRLKDDDVRTRCVFRGVLAPDTFAEVVFWTQRILFFGPSSPTLFLHSSSVQRGSLVGRG